MPAAKRTAPDQIDPLLLSLKKAKIGGVSEQDVSATSTPGDDEEASLEAAITEPSTPLTEYSTTSRPKNYHCPYEGCNKSFSRPVRLAEHQRSHTNERPFICEETDCGKTFLRDSHLKRHVTSAHTEERKYICNWPGCDKKFSTGTRLRRHLEGHDEKEKYRCVEFPPCNEVFRKHKTLQDHIKIVHLNERPYVCDLMDPATGEPCTCGYDTAQRLKVHQERIHSGPRHFCSKCTAPTGFVTYNELTAHMREAHPPVCELCGKHLSTHRELQAHMEFTHSALPLDERKAVKCPYCDSGFTKEGNLKIHIASQHKDVRPFVCGHTDRSDSNKPEVAAWQGEGACGKGFASRGNLDTHIMSQHLGIRKRATERQRQSKKRASKLDALTGVDQANDRFGSQGVPCTFHGCAFLFPGDNELVQHLQTFHCLADQEVAEALAERNALAGGQFWFGGYDAEEDEANRALDAQYGMQYADSQGVDVHTRVQWHGHMNVDGEEDLGEVSMLDAVTEYLQDP